MDYKEYKAVMADSQLEESQLVRFFLSKATSCQKYINSLKQHNAPQTAIDVQIRAKEEWIWTAIFTAQDEKKQGWKYVEDGEKVKLMLLQQLEDIKKYESLKEKNT